MREKERKEGTIKKCDKGQRMREKGREEEERMREK